MSGKKWNEWNSIQTHVSNFEYSNVNVKVYLHIYIYIYIWFWPKKVGWFKLVLWYLGSPILRLIVNLWLCALDKSFCGMDHYHSTKTFTKDLIEWFKLLTERMLLTMLLVDDHVSWYMMAHFYEHHPFEFCCCSINVSKVFNISWSILYVLHIACLHQLLIFIHCLSYAHGFWIVENLLVFLCTLHYWSVGMSVQWKNQQWIYWHW